jgi:N-acylneuraminate cytidylyltransferase
MKRRILAIIPCRAGSKDIPNKNILKVFGKPLFYYSIFFAKKCNFIDKIVVSTDSIKYKKIANKFGIKSSPLRPKKLSKNNSLDIDFIKYELKILKENENYIPEVIILLRPTSPLRKIKILKRALAILLKKKNIESVRSISLMTKSVYKMWSIKKNFIKPIIKNDTGFTEPCNAPRQKLNPFFYQNGIYDLFKTKILKKNRISGKKIFGLKTIENIDIDNYTDVANLKKHKKKFIKFNKFILS